MAYDSHRASLFLTGTIGVEINLSSNRKNSEGDFPYRSEKPKQPYGYPISNLQNISFTSISLPNPQPSDEYI
jgi:hypothetical protein